MNETLLLEGFRLIIFWFYRIELPHLGLVIHHTDVGFRGKRGG